jgi:hypothetical protein
MSGHIQAFFNRDTGALEKVVSFINTMLRLLTTLNKSCIRGEVDLVVGEYDIPKVSPFT